MTHYWPDLLLTLRRVVAKFMRRLADRLEGEAELRGEQKRPLADQGNLQVSENSPVISTPHLQPDSDLVLDMDYLQRTIGLLPLDQWREFIDLFTSVVRADLPTGRPLLARGDGYGIAQLMQKLKSSARMVGAQHFANLAERLEEAAHQGWWDRVRPLYLELEQALGDVETAATDLMAPLPGLTAVQTPTLPPISSSLPTQRILLVDDDPVARHQADLLLKALGIQGVQIANGGNNALEQIAQDKNHFDLLIIDLHMPEMDGIELVRRLAHSQYKGDLALCSGVDERLLETAAELVRAKGLNLRGTLTKPMTQTKLAALLTRTSTKQVASPHWSVREIHSRDISEGLAHNEFTVHFQPKVDTMTMEVVGVEALARWRHQGWFIAPDHFIRVAEEATDLIGPLSEFTVSKALLGGIRLARAGFPLNVAVNLSATWLSDLELPERLELTTHAAGFQCEQLTLEITETGLIGDPATSLDILTRLRLKGFQLSIDDFGTGYSSMEQLQRIPFNELKLDRRFVQSAPERPAARAILASSVDIARKLGLSTVAEGVETQEQLDLVRRLGCNQVQGWLIAKAMPLEELLHWLHAYHTGENSLKN